jgi:hypothetical protein
VLLAPTGARAPERRDAARAVLDGHGWMIHDAHDPLGALAELCVLDRTQATRQEWGLQTVEELALVVVEPSSWPDHVPAMLAAAARYVPQATLWSVEGGDLRPLDAGDRAADCRARPGTARRTPPGRTPDDQDISPPLISGDEIAMLLEDDQGEPTP